MKKISVFICLLGMALHSAIAADKSAGPLSVAVFGFNDAEKRGGVYGSKVTTLVTASLTTESNIIMVERMDLKKALGEQALGASGMVNSEQAAKIGQLTGAKVLVSGQVIKTEKNRLVIVANIVGTETGRLFAQKVEGQIENLTDLTSDLSHKIAQTIHEHGSNFVAETKSHEDYLQQIVKGVVGTNRPTVELKINWPQGPNRPCIPATTEMGLILQKAGFTVVDGHSERKPDVEIKGRIEMDAGPRRSGLSQAMPPLTSPSRNAGPAKSSSLTIKRRMPLTSAKPPPGKPPQPTRLTAWPKGFCRRWRNEFTYAGKMHEPV